jgi:homoserine dehydrogenase
VVAVSAASGGVGGLAAQLARRAGARVLGIASAANAGRLRAISVEPVVYGDGLADRLRSLAPDGIDAFIDTHGVGYVDLAVALGVNPGRIDTIIDFAAAQRHGAKTDASPQASGLPQLNRPISGVATAQTSRIWLVGFGTVGRWLAGVLDSQAEQLAARYGTEVVVVGIATARDGFVYHGAGLDLAAALEAASAGRSIADLRGVRCWPSAIDGLRATEADLLVEVSASPAADGEPGFTHMREALLRRIPVITSNKWPVALHGVELAALARRQGVAFRAESTVMSGTPVLSALCEGLAGAVPFALRGLLNATANFIVSRMADGQSYEDALAQAQSSGLAERDPVADVEGYDTTAKVMILSGLVFGRQLSRGQVACRGITGITSQEIGEAASARGRLKHVATLEFSGPDGAGSATARVQPELVPLNDPLQPDISIRPPHDDA